MKLKMVILAGSLALNAIVFLAASQRGDYIVNKSTAEVDKLDGIFLFVNSQPVSEYTVLGTVKVGFGGPEFEGVRDELLKKVRKSYPNANGVLFHFNSNGADKADAILLK